MNNYKVGTQIYVTKKIIFYPIRSVSSKEFKCDVTYRDTLKEHGKVPDFLKMGTNILDSSDWKKLMDERKNYVDINKGSLRVNAYDGMTPEISNIDKKNSVFQFQVINPDIVEIENHIYKDILYNLVAFKNYDSNETNLNFSPSRVNVVHNMKHYDMELRDLLNSALTVFTNDEMIDKYKFIDIKKVSADDAVDALNGSGRTIFALKSNHTIHDFYSPDKGRIEKKRTTKRNR